MTRHALLTGLAAAGLLASVSCQTQPAPAPAPPASNVTPRGATRPGSSMPDFGQAAAGPSVRGKVVESLDASRYTYVRVDVGGSEVWAAAPQFDVAVGDQVVVSTAMPMESHESTTLGRTFDLVYFNSEIPIAGKPDAAGGALGSAMGMPPGHPPMPDDGAAAGAAPATPSDFSDVSKVEGGLTVAEVCEKAASLKGQQVVVRGKVVKFTGGVMGHNWIHLQDGTGADGTNDLTVTTDDVAQIGDVVTVRGTVVTEQDFGFGYAYDVLVQEAAVTTE